MNGYPAFMTAKLRSDQRFSKLPIIAMTAHATIEERQRCLATGMNDHVSKPIDPGNLFETVGRFYKSLEASATKKQTEVHAPKPDDLPKITGLNTADGLTRVAGNRKLYLKLLRQFAEQQGSALQQIEAALDKDDTALAERLAHTLKGVAGNIGAKSIQNTAAALEKLIRDRAQAQDIKSAKEQAANVLDPLVSDLQAALRSTPPEPTAQANAPVQVSPEQCREAAVQLSRLLSEFDPGAADFIEANQAALRTLFAGDGWPEFEKLVQGYSFADAQERLELALQNFPTA